MAISIKGSKPARSTSTRSNSAKASPKTRTTTAKTKTPARSRTAAKAKNTTATTRSTRRSHPAKGTSIADGTRRSSKANMTQKELNSYLKPLERASSKRDEFHAKWKEFVAESNEALLEALDAGVPINLLIVHGNISRQHVYKLLEDAKNGKLSNGSASKPRAKAATKTVAKTGVKRGPGRPKGSKNKVAAKRSTSRIRAKR